MKIGSVVLYRECFILRTAIFGYRVLTPDGLALWTTYTRSGAHNLIDSYSFSRLQLQEKRGY